MQAQVRGFVTGGLLSAWCTRDTPADVEACLSYLRGVFDTLVAQSRDGGGDTVDCIPDRVSVTELRVVFNRFIEARPDRRHVQASVVVAESFADNYEC